MRRQIPTAPLGDGTHILLGAAGVEIEVYPLGEAYAEGVDGCYAIALHGDGSSCLDACECGREGDRARTVLWLGEAATVGAWTWRAGLTELVGWRRTGPSEAEADLADRVEILCDDLDAERGRHAVTSLDLARSGRQVQRLVTELDEHREGLARVAAERARITAERDRAERWALALVVVAVALAAALAWSVIA